MFTCENIDPSMMSKSGLGTGKSPQKGQILITSEGN